jgi:hypothetical protein
MVGLLRGIPSVNRIGDRDDLKVGNVPVQRANQIKPCASG